MWMIWTRRRGGTGADEEEEHVFSRLYDVTNRYVMLTYSYKIKVASIRHAGACDESRNEITMLTWAWMNLGPLTNIVLCKVPHLEAKDMKRLAQPRATFGSLSLSRRMIVSVNLWVRKGMPFEIKSTCTLEETE